MDKFEQKKKMIERWLIEVIKHKQDLMYLAYCNEDAGLKLCGCEESIHIYRGLEKIAFYLGLTLNYNPNWYENKGQITANYNGIRLYQIWNKKEVEADD